jgi:hypothetical protein
VNHGPFGKLRSLYPERAVVLRPILADRGGVLVAFGAVQEHRGDERGGFLDAG